MTDNEFADWLPDHLAETYGFRAERITRPQAHNPFVLRVDHDGGPPWIARAFGPRRPRELTEGDAEILRLLEERSFPAERCAHDEAVSIAGDHTVLVTTFVEGDVPTTSKDSMREFGALLGELHTAAELTGAGARDGGAWHGASEGLPSADLAAGLAMLDEVGDRVGDAHRAAFDRLREQVAAADSCSDLPRALVHPDPGPVNAVRTTAGLAFVDWTGAGRGPRVASLALLLSVAGSDLGAVDSVVDGYRNHIKLDRTELDGLDAAMRIRPLFWACYYYRMSVQSGYLPSGSEGWWPQFDAIDRAADRARARFVESD